MRFIFDTLWYRKVVRKHAHFPGYITMMSRYEEVMVLVKNGTTQCDKSLTLLATKPRMATCLLSDNLNAFLLRHHYSLVSIKILPD